LGAALGGPLLTRLGSRRALTLFALLTALCLACYALAAYSGAGNPGLAEGYWLWLVLVSFEHIVSSMATVALFAMMMGYCRRGSEGGDYTLQASVVVVCTGAASALSGFSAEGLGYAGHFTLAAVFTFCVALGLWLLPKRIAVLG
jgi:nitrate/nitrite transporter NarK